MIAPLGFTIAPTLKGVGADVAGIAFDEQRAAVAGSAELADDPRNLHVARAGPSSGIPPIYFTAHLDHPAFTVERLIGPGTLQVGFRGQQRAGQGRAGPRRPGGWR